MQLKNFGFMEMFGKFVFIFFFVSWWHFSIFTLLWQHSTVTPRHIINKIESSRCLEVYTTKFRMKFSFTIFKYASCHKIALVCVVRFIYVSKISSYNRNHALKNRLTDNSLERTLKKSHVILFRWMKSVCACPVPIICIF